MRSADVNRGTISYTVTSTSGTIRLCICTIGSPLIIPKFNYKGLYTETEYPVRSISDHQTIPNLNQYTVSESPSEHLAIHMTIMVILRPWILKWALIQVPNTRFERFSKLYFCINVYFHSYTCICALKVATLTDFLKIWYKYSFLKSIGQSFGQKYPMIFTPFWRKFSSNILIEWDPKEILLKYSLISSTIWYRW